MRRVHFNPKPARRATFTGTRVFAYRRVNWTVVFFGAVIVSILAVLGVFLWMVHA